MILHLSQPRECPSASLEILDPQIQQLEKPEKFPEELPKELPNRIAPCPEIKRIYSPNPRPCGNASELTSKKPFLPCPNNEKTEGKGKHVAVAGMIGGLGDRLKGMVNGFVLALLSGRSLNIMVSKLGDSLGSMQPKDGCTWPEEVPQAAMESGQNWDINVIDNRGEIFSQTDFDTHQNSPVWTMVSNMPFADELIYNPQFSENPLTPALIKSHKEGKLFHQVLRSLIQPSPEMERIVQGELDRQFQNGKYFLIGIHLRAGDQKMGGKRKRDEYRGTHSQSIRMVPDEALHCFYLEAMAIWDEVPEEEQSLFPDGPLFFITTDYPSGAKVVMEKLAEVGYRSFDGSALMGRVIHLAEGGDQSRTFTDWWLLTKCRKMVITASGYSEIASKWNCVPTNFFVNHPTLKQHNDFSADKCVHHFIRMRGDGLCAPEMDDAFLYEYFYYRYN